MKPSRPSRPEGPPSVPSSASVEHSDHAALQQRYRDLTPLGEGGNAAVFRAHDVVRDQWVALKRLRSSLDTRAAELARLMLETEYHTLKQLEHPSIIEVYDYGIDRQLGAYYTMELLSGHDLQALSPLPWRDACRVLMSVASSLAVVHSRRLLHRDVTARNVRLTTDGTARLLDFGALTQMGLAKNVVGTPPYVAPEAVCQQPLDGRADLYSLGALAYFAISGAHAFPARDFRELRQLWHTRPPPLRSFDASVPEALDALVMSLLDADMLSRPQSAAEVMARLSAIAGLPLTEAADVQHAYLATPKLVARGAALIQARTHVLRAVRGQPSTVLIGGAAGLGRSRLLDACVLDAELAGAVVLRADATDGNAPFGVARRLLRRLLEARPALNPRTIELGLQGLLAHGDAAISALPRRDALIGNAVQLLLRASTRQLLAIAIDDAHAIDEPSLALLASLAEEANAHRLVLMLTQETGAPTQSGLAWDVLGQSAHVLTFAPLAQDDTRTLLASIFGEVPRLDMLAALLHRSCRGSPRDIMDAAQRITDAQLVRYAGGQWFISDQPGPIAACAQQSSDVHARLALLPAAARELLEIVALDLDLRLTDGDYPVLCSSSDAATVHWALNDLLRQRWLVHTENSLQFVRDSDRRGVESAIEPQLGAALHLRIAEQLQTSQRDPVYEIYHFVQANQADRAHPAMARYLEMADNNPLRIRAAIELDMVERMVEVGAAERWPLPLLTLYRMQSMLLAAAFGAWERALPHAAVTMEALAELAGLSDYRSLSQLPAADRLRAAISAAQSRFAAVPEGSHPLPPIQAVRALTRVCTLAAASAYWMTEPSVFELIPSLAPLIPLSPALALTERIVSAFRALVRGQEWSGWDAFKQLYIDICAMPATLLDARNRYTLEIVVLSPVCFRDARHAASSTLEHCAALAPKQPDQAQNYAMLYHLVMGDAVAVEHARSQCELSTLRAGATRDTWQTRLQVSSVLFPLTDDLMALRRLSSELEGVCEQRPGWRFTRDLITAHVLRCQGQLEQALTLIEGVLAEMPEAHLEFAGCAQAHVWILTELGQLERALAAGTAYRERARALDIPTAWLDLVVARCMSRMAKHEQAERLWQEALAALSAHAIGGVHIGFAYEVGARIARAHGDTVAYEQRCEGCANSYLTGSHPALAAKYRRLVAEASPPLEYVSAAASAGSDAVHTALSQCADRPERAAHATALLREHTQANGVMLFGIRAGRLEPLVVEDAVAAEALGVVQSCLTRELEADAEITRTAAAGTIADLGEDSELTDGGPTCEIAGSVYRPVLLRTTGEHGPCVVGMALLRTDSPAGLGACRRLLPSLSRALLALGDVEPLYVSS